jgi:bifunctional non-homologous end joining protein LigD
MKHSKVWAFPGIRRVKIQEKTKVGEYLIVDTLPALVSLVQMNILEIHTWNTCVNHLEHPDRIVFDLDPGEDVKWEDVVDAARLVRRLLRKLHLESYPKTTGGNGLHVVVPVIPDADWRACLEFARSFALLLEEYNADLFTTNFAKAGREKKILVDYLRNNRTNTSVAAYSTRAKPGAPISMPLRWTDLTPRVNPRDFNVLTVERRLRTRKDPWAEYWRTKQRLR